MIRFYDDGHLMIDPVRLRAYLDNSEVNIEFMSWKILLYLMYFCPEPADLRELEYVTHEGDGAVQTYICRLRKEIGKEYIYQANRKEGYYFYRQDKIQ